MQDQTQLQGPTQAQIRQDIFFGLEASFGYKPAPSHDSSQWNEETSLIKDMNMSHIQITKVLSDMERKYGKHAELAVNDLTLGDVYKAFNAEP